MGDAPFCAVAASATVCSVLALAEDTAARHECRQCGVTGSTQPAQLFTVLACRTDRPLGLGLCYCRRALRGYGAVHVSLGALISFQVAHIGLQILMALHGEGCKQPPCPVINCCRIVLAGSVFFLTRISKS